MVTRKAVVGTSVLYNILFFPFSSCHMEMSWPYPLRSSFNPANSYQIIDYSMTSPLNADGSNFPCKGYQNDRPIQTTVSYTAGSTYNMTLAGSATHGGGSCQLSLSYDNGATFRVIKSMIGGCPLTDTYDFIIPSYAPAGVALLAWTWQNFEGNREFYMNCAEVNIVSGTPSRREKRQSYSSFNQLPYIWKANLVGINDCVSTESEDPVYPNPGPDVLYGDGLNSSSPPSPGTCDSPTPYGQTYRDLGDSSQPAASSVALASTPSETSVAASSLTATTDTVYPSFSYAPLSTTEVSLALSSSTPSPSLLPSVVNQRQASASNSYTTITITVDCASTVISTTTITPSPSHYTTTVPPSACTGTSASCPCARGYSCQELRPCTWACNPHPTPTTLHSSTSRRTTVTIRTTHTVTPVKPTSSTHPPSPPAHPPGHPPYATAEDVEHYLPCIPGTFICTSASTWDTCAYNDGSDHNAASTAWVYDYPRHVSAGMQCVAFLSPYASHQAQQGMTPKGYYRNDRIVRARPDGDCAVDESIKCTGNGATFEVCDQGGWVNMGSVAKGTKCVNGAIVGSS